MAQDFFGHEVGISQVVKQLRLNEHADLVKAGTAQHKRKNLAAHPAGDLDVRVRLAFGKTFIKKDPLMDNDPWKQKASVKHVDHDVKKTYNNDVAVERSETACCAGKRQMEPMVLRMLITDTSRHFSAACTTKKTRDLSAQVDADAKPPLVDVSQCHTLDILNCGAHRVAPSVDTHEKMLEQVCANMDAVKEDMERIVNAFGLSAKIVDIEWPNTSRSISVDGLSGLHNQKEAFRSSEGARWFSGGPRDEKFTVPISFVPYQVNQRRPLQSAM